MRKARSRLARLALLLGLVAWVLGLGASEVHSLVTVHVECADHGELVEISLGESTRAAEKAVVDVAGVDDSLDGHDHGCALDGIVLSAMPAVLVPPMWSSGRLLRSARGRPVDVCRGSPLAYAPKTSPPLT